MNRAPHRKTLVRCIVGIAIVIVFGYWLFAPFVKIRSLQSKFDQVPIGADADQVVAVMGRGGYRNNDPGELDFYGFNESIEKTVRYSVPTFFVGVGFEFAFIDGRVAGKHRYD